MTQQDYTVRLDSFEGPLDLLLFLIRRAEVEITDIPIAKITEQYLAHLEDLTAPSEAALPSHTDPAVSSVSTRGIDIERAGEFLVMAATLMEIKSRMLAPPATQSNRLSDETGAVSDSGATEEIIADPRAELVRQLLEYKRFRDATERLENYRDEYFSRYPAARAPLMDPLPEQTSDAPPSQNPAGDADSPLEADPDQGPVDLEDTTIVDLIEAFARIMSAVDFSRVGEHRVVYDDTPIELHAEEILHQLRSLAEIVENPDAHDAAQRRLIEFGRVFQGKTRSEAIGLFLAMLELVKQRKIVVRQEVIDSGAKITLELCDETPDAATVPETQSAAPSAESAESDQEHGGDAGGNT